MQALSNFNFPLLSIPAYHVLAMYPHIHAMSVASQGDPKRMDNSNPHGSGMLDKIKQRLSAKDFSKYERAESCHRNSLENEPLYIAAVLAGLLAEKSAGRGLGVGLFAGAFLGLRTLYTVLYINTESRNLSFVRSGVWALGVFSCFGMIGRAAMVLA